MTPEDQRAARSHSTNPGRRNTGALLDASLEHAAVGIAQTNQIGRFTWINATWCEMLGYTRGELLSMTMQQVTHPDDLAANLASQARLVSGERTTDALEQRFLRKDGSIFWGHLSLSVARQSSRGSASLLYVVTDITDRKHAEAERARLLSSERSTRARTEATNRELRAIQAIAEVMLADLSLDALLPNLLERVSSIMGFDNAAILLRSPEDEDVLVLRAVHGPEEDVAADVRVPVGQGFAGRIAATGEPLEIFDLSTFPVVTTFLRGKLSSLIGVPLITEGRVLGVIHVGSATPRRFTAEEVQLLQVVAHRVAVAIDRAQAHEETRRTRAATAALARELETVMEAMADAIVIYDRDGRLARANTAARALLGFESDPAFAALSLADRTLRLRIRDSSGHPLDIESVPFTRVLRGEVLAGTDAIDLLMTTLDGREIHVSVTGSPLRDGDGGLVGAVFALRDVTERRLLEMRTHAALNAVLEMAKTLVEVTHELPLNGETSYPPETGSAISPWTRESERRIARRIAELICDILGCTRVGIIALAPETEALRAVAVVGLSPDQEARWWAERQALEQQHVRFGDSGDPSDIARFRAGETFILDMTKPPYSELPNPYGISTQLVAPMRAGERLVGILSLDYGGPPHHFTSEETALAVGVAQLGAVVLEREWLLQERAAAQAEVLALQEATRRMDYFLGIAGHELRTPVTVMKANLQLSSRAIVSATSADLPSDIRAKLAHAQKLLVTSEQQVERLNRMIGDLLDVTRIRAGKLELRLETADIATVVHEAVEHQRLAWPGRQIHFMVADDAHISVEIDSGRIAQVVANLLTNALKYADEEAPIVVRVAPTQTGVRVEVIDQGPGLSDQAQIHIWEPFHQVPEVRQQSGPVTGLGLGLYVCRTIIEGHGGTIGVRSQPGHGATFWFELPRQ